MRSRSGESIDKDGLGGGNRAERAEKMIDADPDSEIHITHQRRSHSASSDISYVPGKPQVEERRGHAGLGATTMCLSIALAIDVVVAAVAAGVASSIVAKRQTSLNS